MFEKKQDPEILNLKNRVAFLELELEKLKTHIISLRGLVNRKLGSTETIKSDIHFDGLDKLRDIN